MQTTMRRRAERVSMWKKMQRLLRSMRKEQMKVGYCFELYSFIPKRVHRKHVGAVGLMVHGLTLQGSTRRLVLFTCPFSGA